MRCLTQFAAIVSLTAACQSATPPVPPAPPPPPPPVALLFDAITAGYYATCGVGLDSAAYCWGEGRYGQLGSPAPEECSSIPGESPCASAPRRVSGTRSFISISAGGQHACAISAIGHAFCWGDNQFGQLGTSSALTTCGLQSTPCARAPVSVLLDGPLASISTGDSHSCAVQQGGAGFCWGYGAYGRLGNGSAANTARPDSVRGGFVFRSIVAGGSFSCGIVADSTIYCWGFNHLGQLGNTTTTTSLLPTPITGNRHFVQVTAGLAHACAVTSQAEAYCWGSAIEGELGSAAPTELCGGYACNKTPVLVAGGIAFISLAAGHEFTCGSSATASYCWGAIPGVVEFGRGLGLKAPTAFGTRGADGGEPFLTMSTSYDHACGITTAHKAYCWGSDYHGKLGNGPDSAGVAPVLVVMPDSTVP